MDHIDQMARKGSAATCSSLQSGHDDAHAALPPSGPSVRQKAKHRHPLTPQHPRCRPGSMPLPSPPPRQALSQLGGPVIGAAVSDETETKTNSGIMCACLLAERREQSWHDILHMYTLHQHSETCCSTAILAVTAHHRLQQLAAQVGDVDCVRRLLHNVAAAPL